MDKKGFGTIVKMPHTTKNDQLGEFDLSTPEVPHSIIQELVQIPAAPATGPVTMTKIESQQPEVPMKKLSKIEAIFINNQDEPVYKQETVAKAKGLPFSVLPKRSVKNSFEKFSPHRSSSKEHSNFSKSGNFGSGGLNGPLSPPAQHRDQNAQSISEFTSHHDGMLKNVNQMSVKSMQRSFGRVKSDQSINPDIHEDSRNQTLVPDSRVKANTSRMVRKAAKREREQLLKE